MDLKHDPGPPDAEHSENTMTHLERNIYVVGVAETALGEVSGETELSMVAKAAREALGEAGLSLRDVDGLFVNYMGEQGSVQVGEYLGVQPRYADSSDFGGGTFEAFVHHAMLALAAGRCDVALIAYASRQRSKRSRRIHYSPSGGTGYLQTDRFNLTEQFQSPCGIPTPIGGYALIAAQHMHQYGTTPEQLAAVAVTARSWAQLNPKAWSRTPLTVDEVLSSRMICDPLHKLDCCLITDGGGVVVMTHAERARDSAKHPIRVLGAGESHTHWHIGHMPEQTASAGAVAAREAFEMAGIKPADVDVLEPYDAFTINVIVHLEDLGFCHRGEGGPFVQEGHLSPGGKLPAMTSGGGLSYCHPGALGILLLIEAVRQLRSEAGARQVPDAKIAVAHGMGGYHSFASTVVLARD
jgi:acetyl-CoA acetyltransferase